MLAVKKQKTCKVCSALFMPVRPMARVCSPHCALSMASTQRAKAEKIERVKDRKDTKEKLERLKTRGDRIREAQTAFNAFIRARDAGLPCICCGRYGNGQVPGGEWDAGHYRSRGAAPHLRFDERNVHAQLKQCNRYAAGNISGYRVGLIARLGPEVVEAIEADQEPRKYTEAELIAIKRDYTARAKALLKGQV